MNTDEIPINDETMETIPSSPSTPATNVEYSRTVSQNLRHLDDALNHAIDQLKIFNSETMSDLSLKYELMRNNESRVIGFFARQLTLLQEQKIRGQNGGFHSEYSKLDRFLSVINLNPKSIEYIVERVTFDDLLNGKAAVREKLLYDAGTNEAERRDFRGALNALKDCIDYFSHGGTNDNGRFYWHTETPTTNAVIMSPYSVRQHRLSDTALPVPPSNENPRSTSVSSSLSTEFGPVNNAGSPPPNASASPYPRRSNANQTPPPSRSNHLCVNGKGKCEHPSKKSSVDPSIFTGSNSSRNFDLQLPEMYSNSRRSSYGSDTESRLPSGAATPKSPTIRSPTMSGSPIGSAHNSDTENDPRTPDTPVQNPYSPIFRHRMAHKIQHKFVFDVLCMVFVFVVMLPLA